jgi:hypothetical protein
LETAPRAKIFFTRSASMKRAGSEPGTKATPHAAGRPRASSVLFGLVLLAALAFPGGCNNYNLSLENFFSGSSADRPTRPTGVFPADQTDSGPDIDFEDFGPVSPDSIIRIPVANAADWGGALVTIQNGGTDKNYVITLTNDVSLTSPDGLYFGTTPTGSIKVSLRGAKTLSLVSPYSGNLLALGNNQTLILREATLKGHSGNTSSMIHLNNGSTFFMKSGSISDNTNTSGSGGGVYVNGNGVFTMSGGTIGGNSASINSGGGVYVDGNGVFTMRGGTISGNTAAYNGGGVAVGGTGNFSMLGGTISGNHATGNSSSTGGGVYFSAGGTFIMSGGTIIGNDASGTGGGGVRVASGSFTMSGGTIDGNHATGGSGGGVFFSSASPATFTMSGGTISGNDASNYGGGVSVDSGSSFTMSGSAIISGNTATGSGGGVVSGGSFIMNSGTISGNTTYGSGGGGGVYVITGSSTFTMSGGTISGNHTTHVISSGGGVYVNSGSFSKTAGTIYGDTDAAHTPNSTENTATSGNTQGHAVYYSNGGNQYYRDTDLFAGDDISTTSVPPTATGTYDPTNWIKKP